MDVHKNARSLPASREVLARRVLEHGWSTREAAEAANLSERRAREWIRRARAGEPMIDRSSRPKTMRRTENETVKRIVELRREWCTLRQIASIVGRSQSTVARICRAAGMSRLRHVEPPVPVVRYERENPGELIHLDIKRLGRFDGVGHRITRKRSRGSGKQGWEYLYVVIDDRSRASYAEIHPKETSATAVAFLDQAVAWFRGHGVEVQRAMTDNGAPFIAHLFRNRCEALGIRHIRTKPYTPKTNGKVERFIQTLLREWAYRFSYRSSRERERWLDPYLHFYNFHRAHSALAYNAPVSRLVRNNLLKRNS